MSKKSLQKEQEVIAQIYDFIFKEAKKKPEKRKPIKASGLNGKGLLTDGLAAALERPGVFLTTQAAKDLQDAFDITLAKIKPNQNDPTAQVKISASNLVDIIKDPMGVMQKAKDTADANRKTGRVLWMGKIMREFTSNGWASRYADIDTQQAVRVGLGAQNLKGDGYQKVKQNWDVRAAIGQAASGRDSTNAEALTNMQERGATIFGRNIFTERGWNALSTEQRERVGRVLSLGQNTDGSKTNLTDQYVIKELQDTLSDMKIGSNAQNEIIRRYGEVIKQCKGRKGSISFSDPEFYRNLELRNIDQRIKSLNRGGQGLSPQEITAQVNTLESAKLIISAQDLGATNFGKALHDITSSISNVRSQIRVETDPKKRAILQTKLKELRGDRQVLNSMSFWNDVGTWEGKWSSFKDNYIDGNLVKNFFSGSFFDPDQNSIAPSSKLKNSDGTDYFVPITEFYDKNGNQVSNAILSTYNKSLVSLYYLTPKSLMRTFLFNGEAFSYLKHLRGESIKNFANSISNVNNPGSAVILKMLGGGALDPAEAQLFSSLIKNNADLAALFESHSRFGKLQQFFGRNAAFKNIITQRYEKFMKEKRTQFVANLMKSEFFRKLFGKEAAGKLLSQWIEKGGLQNIARALVVAVANALGFATTGGIANVAITIVAGFVADILFSIGKVLFGVVVYALIGLVGIIIMTSMGIKDFQQNTYSYASTPPGEVYVNPNFTGTSPIIGEDDDNNLGDFVAGSLPDGEKCLLGTSSSYTCTQGPYSKGSTPEIHTSHEKVGAIDVVGVSYFYAPAFCGSNNCTITSVSSASCSAGYAGGMVKFSAVYGGSTYEFTLIHVDTTYGSGTQLSAGQAVARVMTIGETTRACSSGTHIHIQSKVNGSVVDPREVLNSSPSNGGFGCNIGDCPILFSSW